MKSHEMVASASVRERTEHAAAGGVAKPAQVPPSEERSRRPAPSDTRFAATGRAWTHTLILTGELDRGSANALEAAIDRLCEEGVTGIRLDLRRLAYIDWTGVAVIAFRCGLCQRRGYDFTLIPGPRSIHRVFERAGVVDRLPFEEEDELAIPRQPALVISHRSRDRCEG